MNRVERGSVGAPKFARGETNRVQVLAFFALEVRVGIGKYMHTVIARDGAQFAACISWEPRVPGWIDVAGAYLLAQLELRRNGRIATRRKTTTKKRSRNGSGESRNRFC